MVPLSRDLLLVSIRDTTACEVVGSEFNLHPVARQDADVVHPHLPGDVRQHLVAVLQFDPEHCVRERLGDRAFEHDGVVFGLGQNCLLDRWKLHPPRRGRARARQGS